MLDLYAHANASAAHCDASQTPPVGPRLADPVQPQPSERQRARALFDPERWAGPAPWFVLEPCERLPTGEAGPTLAAPHYARAVELARNLSSTYQVAWNVWSRRGPAQAVCDGAGKAPRLESVWQAGERIR